MRIIFETKEEEKMLKPFLKSSPVTANNLRKMAEKLDTAKTAISVNSTNYEDGFAVLVWSVDDLLASAERRGIKMSRNKAISLMEKNENHIKDGCSEGGWESIECILDNY